MNANDPHTRISAITRASIIRDIATQVCRAVKPAGAGPGILSFEEAEEVIDSVLPNEDVLATLGQQEDPMLGVLKAAEAATKRGWPRTLAVMETKAGSTALIEVGGGPSLTMREALSERLGRKAGAR